jgi:hypothetical protein
VYCGCVASLRDAPKEESGGLQLARHCSDFTISRSRKLSRFSYTAGLNLNAPDLTEDGAFSIFFISFHGFIYHLSHSYVFVVIDFQPSDEICTVRFEFRCSIQVRFNHHRHKKLIIATTEKNI